MACPWLDLELDGHAPQEGRRTALASEIRLRVEGDAVHARLARRELGDAAIGIGVGLGDGRVVVKETNGHARRGHAALDVQYVRRQRGHALPDERSSAASSSAHVSSRASAPSKPMRQVSGPRSTYTPYPSSKA